MNYYNYHKHDHKGNIRQLDVIAKMEDYCKRAVELGHNAIFTTNHGVQGDIFEATTLGKQYGLKVISGCECYYVQNRHEKDKSNKHLVVIALNDNGFRQLNKILSIANDDGYYYKPRVDYELIMQLNPNDVVITTACISGILYDEDLVLKLHNKFKEHFFIEVQSHNEQLQKDWNLKALELSRKYNIKLIHGNDSHYIYGEDSKYRDLFLKGKGIKYDSENKFELDYPDYNTIVKRYKKQNILNESQIFQAINNTLVFDEATPLTIINDDIKMPPISNNPKKELAELLIEKWIEKKKEIPKELWSEYEDAILFEGDIINKTSTHDYFLWDYYIVKRAIEVYKTRITNTGRGSAPSFYINNLLGLTKIDRLNTPCKLFPTRFMSVERILGARSLPDIDINASDRYGLIKATEDLIGKDKCAWMLAYKPLQDSSAFRLYCKAIGMHVSEYDDVAKELDNYLEDEKWKSIINESKHFVGVVESFSESPCSMLMAINDVSENVGLIKIKNKENPDGKLLCLLDGYNCDKYKYLKNDYLTVSVWNIIEQVCYMANIPVPTITEFNQMLDDKTFEIYAKGLTCTINQVDSDYATQLVKKYKPKSISEVCQFVAMIRPGCKSLLDDFLNRRPYTTGVKELDDLLEDSEHRMIYQESIMKYLIWLGIKESESYDIIKKIAKKKFKEQELKELKTKLLKGWIKQVGREDGFEETWIVIEQASMYSFNASHSLSYAYDSLYGAYLKAHFPLEYYTVVLNEYSGDEIRTGKLTNELSYFNIKLESPKFRYSKANYFCDKETNTIYKGIGSIKYCNETIGNELYELKNNLYNTFLDLLIDIAKTSINSRQLEILIKIGFFSEFGKSAKLTKIVDLYNNVYTKSQFKKDNMSEQNIKLFRKYANKETEKLFKEVNTYDLINNIIPNIKNEELPIQTLFECQKENCGSIIFKDKNYDDDVMVATKVNINQFGTPFITLYCLNNGTVNTLKADKTYFNNKPISDYDVIKIKGIDEKYKRRKIDGKWQITEDKEYILSSYAMVL